MSLIKSNVYVCNIKNGTVIRRSHWPSEPWPRSTGKRCRVKGGISVVVPINHRSSLLPWWTLICYCTRAAVRHAADSRWQPGRSGGWGSWRAEGREDRSMWHMWVALGGEDGEVTCLCVCMCVWKRQLTAFFASIQILCLQEKKKDTWASGCAPEPLCWLLLFLMFYCASSAKENQDSFSTKPNKIP